MITIEKLIGNTLIMLRVFGGGDAALVFMGKEYIGSIEKCELDVWQAYALYEYDGHSGGTHDGRWSAVQELITLHLHSAIQAVNSL